MSENKTNVDLNTTPLPLNRYLVFVLIAVIGCLVDLWTKSYVFQQVGRPGEYWIISNFFGLRFGLETTVNYGALFGLGQGFTKFFAFFSVIAAIGICYWLFIKKAAHDFLLTIALAAVMAGIFGNLYDRLGIWGDAGVRDWISVKYLTETKVYPWPNFNIADCLLVVGAASLFLHSLFLKPVAQNSDSNSDTRLSSEK